MEVDDVVGAAFLPTDGQANPSDIAQALAKGARAGRRHASSRTSPSPASTVEDGRVAGRRSPTAGRIDCEKVVICAGQWTRAGRRAWPASTSRCVSVQHQYLITEPIAGVPPDLPTLRDPDRLTYYKEEVGGLVMGGYEPNPKPWAMRGIPERFAFQLLDDDWDHFEPMMELAHRPRAGAGRRPASSSCINGPESFTPDGNFILGEAPETQGHLRRRRLQRLRHRLGRRRRHGAGRMGRRAASRPIDLWPVDIRRFGRRHARHATGCARARWRPTASTTPWPGRIEEYDSGRPLRRSPLYDRLQGAGRRASARSSAGSGRTGSPPPGEEPRDIYSLRPAELVRRRSAASIGPAASAVALFDQTSFAKFLLDRPRRRGGAVLDLRQRRRQAAGQPDLHPDAQRARRHRVRPDRRAARRRRASTSSPAPASPPTTSTGSARNIPAGARRAAGRRHLGLRACCR